MNQDENKDQQDRHNHADRFERHFHRRFAPKFAGAGTVGERGQVVIPAEVREEMDIKPGDKLLFMSRRGVICMIKADRLHGYMERMTNYFNDFKQQFNEATNDETPE